ncbi:MAG TPA: hypothetical protein VFR31_06620, partial [Thermoanaerobaculia bacterium]|nr:hypothetical protein [Thermoanaerobaculia bacterium]
GSHDRAGILDTVRGRLATKLGVASPLVLAASASVFLGQPLPDGTDATTPGSAGDAYRELQALFLETERGIVRSLQEQRTLILFERSAALLEDAFQGIRGDLQSLADRCREEREALAAGLLPPLVPFLDQCRVRHGEGLGARLQALMEDLQRAFAAFRQETFQALSSSMASATTREQIVRTATSGAEAQVAKARESLWGALVEADARIGPEIRGEMDAFEARFLERYGAVADPDSFFTGSGSPRILPKDWPGWTSPKLTQAAREEGRRQASMGCGAVLGVFVGIFLLFGIGIFEISNGGDSCAPALIAFVLSPFVCAYLVSHLYVPIDDLRRAYWSDLAPALEAFFSQVDTAVLRRFEEVQREARETIGPVLDGCLEQYGDRVRAAIASGELRIAALLQNERRHGDDLADLERRRMDLQRARNGLKQIQKL